MPFIDLVHTVEVQIEGEPIIDRWGNERPGLTTWEPRKVAGWWIDQTDEEQGDSVLRTVDVLHVFFPSGYAPTAAEKVRIADGSEWSVQGHAEDYDHGPFGFVPGITPVHCRKVEG